MHSATLMGSIPGRSARAARAEEGAQLATAPSLGERIIGTLGGILDKGE